MPWPATPRHSDKKHVFNSLRPFVRSSLTKLMNIQTGLLSRRSRQRERVSASVVSICSSVCLFVCLSPKCQKTLFSQKVSNLELWCLLTTYRKSYMGIIGPLKSKMAEIRHLENRHDVIFFCWGWCDLDKILQTGAEWHVDCGDIVKIETRCRIPIWRTFGRIAMTCHPRTTCHIAGCCHLVNSLS